MIELNMLDKNTSCVLRLYLTILKKKKSGKNWLHQLQVSLKENEQIGFELQEIISKIEIFDSIASMKLILILCPINLDPDRSQRPADYRAERRKSVKHENIYERNRMVYQFNQIKNCCKFLSSSRKNKIICAASEFLRLRLTFNVSNQPSNV